MAGLSLRAYARWRRSQHLPGTTLKAVQKAVRRGWIHLESDGRIEPRWADREWAALHVPRVSVYRPGTRQRKDGAQDQPAAKDDEGGPVPDNLMSPPLAALHEPLFRLSGKRADLEAVLTAWQRVPELLLALEDGMAAAGVPLLERDMLSPTGDQEAAQ